MREPAGNGVTSCIDWVYKCAKCDFLLGLFEYQQPLAAVDIAGLPRGLKARTCNGVGL
jgi:hypothetical protein